MVKSIPVEDGGSTYHVLSWPAVGVICAVFLALFGYGINGLTGYYHDQANLRVKSAMSVSSDEIRILHTTDALLQADVAVLQAQRADDIAQLTRIENKLDEIAKQHAELLRIFQSRGGR